MTLTNSEGEGENPNYLSPNQQETEGALRRLNSNTKASMIH